MGQKSLFDWFLANNAAGMNQEGSQTFFFFFNYFSFDFSFAWGFFSSKAKHFSLLTLAPRPLDEDTGLAPTKPELETFISLFPENILVLLWGKKKKKRKHLGWDPCKALVFLCLAKIQELQLFSGTPQRMSMCLIFYQWDKKSRKTSSKATWLCPLSTPCAQSHGAAGGFWLHGWATPFLVAWQSNWA